MLESLSAGFAFFIGKRRRRCCLWGLVLDLLTGLDTTPMVMPAVATLTPDGGIATGPAPWTLPGAKAQAEAAAFVPPAIPNTA